MRGVARQDLRGEREALVAGDWVVTCMCCASVFRESSIFVSRRMTEAEARKRVRELDRPGSKCEGPHAAERWEDLSAEVRAENER